jgi:hypothetical protein
MNATDDHYESTPAQAVAPEPAAQAPRQPAAEYRRPALPPTVADPRAKSSILACVLSAMPGLGQVYVGYYQRGFAHAIIVACLITLLALDLGNLTPLAAIFMAFFWLYNIIDAGRRATLYNQALIGTENIDLPGDLKMPGFQGSIFGGMILIGVGFILLMHTQFGFSLTWIEDWWPVAPMLLGVYLMIKAIQERGAKAE